VDAAKHFDDAAPGVDALPLASLIGPAVVLAFDDDVRAIGPRDLERHDLLGRTRVLLQTRNSALQGGDFFSDYTYLAPEGAEWLVERGAELVGIDYLSIEQFRSGHHRTHRTLLSRGVVIVEGLALAGVPAGPYRLLCLPLRITGLDGAPARAVLEEE
jgi:arylformamidase